MIVFIVIIAVAAVALFQTFGQTLPRSPTPAQLVQAAQLAQERMELILGRRGVVSYFLGRELARDAAQGTLALERMTRDLRTARSAADLTTIGASTITFVDVDGNTISYALSAGALTRSQNGGTAQPLAANVNSLAF